MYSTDFAGALVVRPPLPASFLSRWNRARRGTPGREYVRSFQPIASGVHAVDAPDMLPGFAHAGKPQEWCHWKLLPGVSGDGEHVTLVIWDGRDGFLSFHDWLQILVDVIERDVGAHVYDGRIRWCGEDPDDRGLLSIAGSSSGPAVRVDLG